MKLFAKLRTLFHAKINDSQPTEHTDNLSALRKELLKHRDSKSRQNAAKRLGELRDFQSVESLIIALRDPNGDVSLAAAHSLSQIADHRATEPLAQMLLDTIHPVQDRYGRTIWHIDINSTQWYALALAQIGDVYALRSLLVYLRATNHMMKYPDYYRGTVYGEGGAHIARLHALKAIVEFARSSTQIPQIGWKRVKVHIDEYYPLTYPGGTPAYEERLQVKADIELPVSTDTINECSETNVLKELVFPIQQYDVRWSNIDVLRNG
ncbi:MAG: HEAT repeat domain-containing protein [archaeon]|nr:HEAT repeat domain-containing protein [archaeon]